MQASVPDVADRIEFIDMDLHKTGEVARQLISHGWSKEEPSVMVFEGISYYVGPDTLWGLISLLGNGASNYVILEYIVPPNMVESTRSHIATNVFDIIVKNVSNPMDIYRFGYDTVVSQITSMGGSMKSRHTMQSMELKRTGTNQHFPTERSGWIEVACAVTRSA